MHMSIEAAPEYGLDLLVLGGGLEPGGMPTDQTRGRAITAAGLLERYPVQTLIFSGMNSHWDQNSDVHEGTTEAEIMHEICAGLVEIPDEVRVCEERLSTSTIQNFAYAHPRMPSQRAMIVTDRFTVPRTLFIANLAMPDKKAIWPYTPIDSPLPTNRIAQAEATRFAITRALATGLQRGPEGIKTLARREKWLKAQVSRAGRMPKF